ncbi:hypothetical protein ScPMuIL_014674 [Solemya velum]
MYAYVDENDAVKNYQKSVRDRANVSLQELEDVLTGRSPNVSLTDKAKEELTSTVHPHILRWYDGGSRPQKYRNAASHIQQVLQQEDQTPPGPTETRGDLPTPEEAAALLQSQSNYSQQLEAENRYLKDELAMIKAKMHEILEENQRLHEELKKSVLQEILGDGVDLSPHICEDEILKSADLSRSLGPHNYKHLQIELERLSSLHAAKSHRLETQLEHTRSDVQKYEQMVEDLQAQLRMRDAVPTHEDGLPTFLTESQRGFHSQTLNRITKERNELIEHVTSLKIKLQEMSQREEDAYVQMKKGIELVEQAQLEETKAQVQREQLAEELNNMKQRFDQHIQGAEVRIQQEREAVRKENKSVEDELNTKLREMTEQQFAVRSQLEKVARDKMSLLTELEETKIHLKRYDKEITLATDSYKTETTNATLQRTHAVQEVSRLRSELDLLKNEKDQEKKRFQCEVDDLKRRLNKAERDLVNSKEECIHLTTTTQALERELHLAKLARNSIERGRSEDLKALTKRAESREVELNNLLGDVETQHVRTTTEMDEMLKKQNKLIAKLRDECRRQAGQIERLAKRNRTECGQLKKSNEEFKLRLERAITRLKVLEEQEDQHFSVHEKMKERLKLMDDHAQHQGGQMVELLTRQSVLFRDRQLLARELEFLRKQLLQTNEADLNKFVSSNKCLVDDVLSSVLEEEKGKTYSAMAPSPKVNIDDLFS